MLYIATEISVFSSTSSSALTDFANEAKLLSLALTTEHNLLRADYMEALSTLTADTESARINRFKTYSAGISSANETLLNSIVQAGADLQSALADASETLIIANADNRQAMIVAIAHAGKLSSESIADAALTLAEDEASAYVAHAGAIGTAYRDGKQQVASADETLITGYALADKTFNDALADAEYNYKSSLGGYEAAERSAVTSAGNLARKVAAEQVKLRLEDWWQEIIEGRSNDGVGLADWDLDNYGTFYPIHKAAEATYDKWIARLEIIGIVIEAVPVVGPFYRAGGHFYRGEFRSGGIAVLEGVVDVAMICLLFTPKAPKAVAYLGPKIYSVAVKAKVAVKAYKAYTTAKAVAAAKKAVHVYKNTRAAIVASKWYVTYKKIQKGYAKVSTVVDIANMITYLQTGEKLMMDMPTLPPTTGKEFAQQLLKDMSKGVYYQSLRSWRPNYYRHVDFKIYGVNAIY